MRPAERDDLAALHDLWAEPQVRRFLFDDQHMSVDLAQSALEDCLANAARGLGLWLASPPNLAIGMRVQANGNQLALRR